MRHLDPPYKGTPFVTQTFANASDVEPFGWKYTDGSIGYHWEAGAAYNRWHNGVDLALDDNTTLYAPEDGTVAVAGWDTTGFGWNVLIDHGGDLFTHVAHLKRYDVDAGQHVVRAVRSSATRTARETARGRTSTGTCAARTAWGTTTSGTPRPTSPQRRPSPRRRRRTPRDPRRRSPRRVRTW
jgi:hypothetical protein